MWTWKTHNIEVQTMWNEPMSKQNIPKVHKIAGDVNQADVLIKHVPRAVFDMLVAAL